MGYMRGIGVQRFTGVIQVCRCTGVAQWWYRGTGLCSAVAVVQGCTGSTGVYGYWSSTGVHDMGVVLWYSNSAGVQGYRSTRGVLEKNRGTEVVQDHMAPGVLQGNRGKGIEQV